MEENQEQQQEDLLEQAPNVYKPRPKWQLVCAWIGIAIMIVSFILYCWQIANGGML